MATPESISDHIPISGSDIKDSPRSRGPQAKAQTNRGEAIAGNDKGRGERVALAAYFIAERNGFPTGREQEFWLEAERQITAEDEQAGESQRLAEAEPATRASAEDAPTPYDPGPDEAARSRTLTPPAARKPPRSRRSRSPGGVAEASGTTCGRRGAAATDRASTAPDPSASDAVRPAAGGQSGRGDRAMPSERMEPRIRVREQTSSSDGSDAAKPSRASVPEAEPTAKAHHEHPSGGATHRDASALAGPDAGATDEEQDREAMAAAANGQADIPLASAGDFSEPVRPITSAPSKGPKLLALAISGLVLVVLAGAGYLAYELRLQLQRDQIARTKDVLNPASGSGSIANGTLPPVADAAGADPEVPPTASADLPLASLPPPLAAPAEEPAASDRPARAAVPPRGVVVNPYRDATAAAAAQEGDTVTAGARGLSADEARRFAEKWFAAGNAARRAGDVLPYYAPQVDYYGEGRVSRSFIASDKERYLRRWPNRRFKLADEVRVLDGGSALEKTAILPYTYEVANGKQRRTGRGIVLITIRKDGERLAITGVKERMS